MVKRKKQREQPVAPTAETSGKKIEFTPGFVKKTRKTPTHEIDKAKRIRAEVLK